MDREHVLELFQQINVWKRGNQRAPHKPLLLLYALGKCARGEAREIPYREVDEKLKPLLMEFGPRRESYHPEYPFWRLQNDGLWELSETERLERRASNSDAKKSELFKYDVRGGLSDPIYQMLRQDHRLLMEVVNLLLENNFPASVHEDICMEVGLQRERLGSYRGTVHDSAFHSLVLTAYDYRCSVCGFDVRLGERPVALEAAHIKWRQAGGPDIITNGLALCIMHHKLFDLGAFTISDERRIRVSSELSGDQGLEEWAVRYNGQSLSSPKDPADRPATEFLHWHHRQVFKGER